MNNGNGAYQMPKKVADLIRADAPASAARTALGLGSVATHDASEFAAAAGSTSVVTVGTVTTGTWHGSTIGVAYGGTGLATVASGKLLYASALDTLAALNLDASLGISGGTLSVQANTVNQKVVVSKAGTTIGTRKQINLIEGSNVTLTVADNSGSDRVDVTVAASGGGGGSPGGSSGQLQYNDAGAFGGAAGITYAASATILQARAQATSDVPLVARGFSAGQTANLQQWQAADGTVVLQVNSDGVLSRQDGANLQIKSAGSLDIYCGNVFDFRFGHSTAIGFQPQADNTHPLGGATNRWSVLCAGQVQALCGDAGTTPELVKGAGGQTANLAEWQKSDATVYGTVSENGYFTTRKNSAPADAELTAGEAAWWLDSTNGSAKLMIKAKQANGTVVTGNVALT